MFHQLSLTGHVGQDPNMRYMPDGTGVTNFSVAVRNGYGDNEHTLWVRVAAWGKRAEVCNQYLSKGDKVQIVGRLSGDPNTGNPRLWTHQDGTVGASFEVRADQVIFLTSRAESNGNGNGHNGSVDTPVAEVDEIPF